MFFSIEQITESLPRLGDCHPFFGISFFAFKAANLPIGRTAQFILSQAAAAFMDQYFTPSPTLGRYYNPFQSSKGKGEERWVAPRYPSTSLQRITKDTFGGALIHPERSSDWGFRPDYVARLKEVMRRKRIALCPAFDLAVWLFRSKEWSPKPTAEMVRDELFREFRITDEERSLFDLAIPQLAHPWLAVRPATEQALLQVIGRPESAPPDTGAGLRSLALAHVGPTTELHYEPAPRLNMVTGDNALGKTFLLDCIYWALTGHWADRAMLPRFDAGKNAPRIAVEIDASSGGPSRFTAGYRWEHREWNATRARTALPGVVIYARFDGSFAVWDRARLGVKSGAHDESSRDIGRSVLFLPHEVWHGVPVASGRPELVCNGLLADWLAWYRGGPKFEYLRAKMDACVNQLSPDPDRPLRWGTPRVLPGDSRELFTLVMPYDEVPVMLVSAGIRRVLAMAYVMVWAWNQHLQNSADARTDPDPRVILLLDEVEAHLHPRWQRVIVPSLMAALTGLIDGASPQVHLATHSPLVMASSEPLFSEATDAVHHLALGPDGRTVMLERFEFARYGRADRWLASDLFDRTSSRSVDAQKAIDHANAIQRGEVEVETASVAVIHDKLLRLLAPDDEYWPRWLSFVRRHGVEA